MISIGIHTGSKDFRTHFKILGRSDQFKYQGYFLFGPEAPGNGNNAFDSFMAGCDAILFLDYQSTHYSNLVKAVKASRHVFVDTLIHIGFYEAQELIKLVSEADITFQIGVHHNFYSSLKSHPDVFESPGLIESIINYTPEKKNQHPDLFNQNTVETIFQLIQLIKGNVKRVMAKSVSVWNEMADVASIHLEFDNGCSLTLCLSKVNKSKKQKIFFYKNKHVTEIRPLEGRYYINAVKDKSPQKGRLLNYFHSKRAELEDFYYAIQKNHSGLNSIDNAAKTLEVMNKIKEKIRISSNQV